jgi:excisionase family DNA binding protein
VQPADDGPQEGGGLVSESVQDGNADDTVLALVLRAADLQPLVDQVTAAVLDRLGKAHVSPWMNVVAAAEYLQWPKKRLYNFVATNEIPHRKQGNRLLFNRSELDTWLNRFYQGPGELAP